MDHDRRLQMLRSWQRLLDTAYRIPGTNVRFGWDPIIGLIPWLGDVVAALFAGVIIVHAHRMRIPRVIQVRMLINVAADVVIGLIPFLGDVADVFWKASSRNLMLLESQVADPRPASVGDYLFVAAVLAAILLVALLPVALAWWFFDAILRRPLL